MLERQLLGRLCAANLSERDRRRALELLATYSWCDPEHEIVFRSIQRAAQIPRTCWHDELPAQATRMGFPEVDWSRYFDESDRRGMAMEDMLARLARERS